MKLKTKIEHTFDIDPGLMENLDFNISIPKKSMKKKVKIIEIKNRKFRKDASTRLF